MFDDLYSQLTKKADYRLLTLLPVLIAILAVAVVFVNGVELGIDFKGGTWVEVVPEKALSTEQLASLSSDLKAMGLEDLKAYLGKDIVSGSQTITVVTTSQVNETLLESVVSGYAGRLYDMDTVYATVGSSLPSDVEEKLASRFAADVVYNSSSGILAITALDLDAAEVESAVEFYVGQPVSVELESKNINIRPVGETLGKTFREQAVSAFLMAYVLIIAVVFIAFRDPVPSLAVIFSGTCDALVALGGMSLFGIPLEPASLVSLLMIVGYSIDTDILLTSRVLKTKTGTVDDRVNDSMKTGLTMMATTITVMCVMLFISTVIVKIDTLASIAAVLLMGLLADIPNTWLSNAGILKWYIEEKGGKFSLKGLMGKK